MAGWFAVTRASLSHPMFKREPVSEWEAWMRMIARAAHTDTVHRVKNELVEVPRGSFFCTLRDLQSEFMWRSDFRVRAFLELLENERMIQRKTNAGKTHITICNYDEYQKPQRADNAKKTHSQRTANALNNKGTNKQETTPQPPKGGKGQDSSEFDEWYSAYPKKEAKGRARKAFIAARKKASLEVLVAGAKAYAVKVAAKDRTYIALPATWLNDERWLDAETPAGGSNVGAVPTERRVQIAKDWLSRNDSIPTWMDSRETAEALISEGYDYDKLRLSGFSLPPRGNVVDISQIARGVGGAKSSGGDQVW